MAPWHSHWAAPQTRRLPTFDPAHPTAAPPHPHPSASHLNVHSHNTDSDYHSMASSQSNSTESLDQLPAGLAASFVAKLDFDRAISKPSPSLATPAPPAALYQPSPAYSNDFLNTPLAQLASFASAAISGSGRRFTIGVAGSSAATAADDARQRMYQRRDSFNGLTDHHPVKPIMGGTLFLNQMHPDYSTPTTSQCDYSMRRHQPPAAVAVTPTISKTDTDTTTTTAIVASSASPLATVLPNMRVPPPNYTSPEVPVFDASRPPPGFAPRTVQRPEASSPLPAPTPAAVSEPKIELYRPRELRQTPLQNVQPPSGCLSSSSSSSTTVRRHTPLQACARAFVPAASSAHQIRRNKTTITTTATTTSTGVGSVVADNTTTAATMAAAAPRPEPSVSKIAAKFTEAPILYVSAPTPPVLMHDFPSLAQTTAKYGGAGNSPARRYIVKQPAQPQPTPSPTGAVRLYQTPVTSAPCAGQPHQSLASIVRTTLPKLMAQQQPTPSPAATAADDGLGMANVNGWLKSLRLHKYQWLFVQMSYTQMLAIDEAYLERLQITKGARNKLVLSVQKLNERYATLERIEGELLAGGAPLAEALDELALVAQSPMKPMQPFVQFDVATKLMKVLNMGE